MNLETQIATSRHWMGNDFTFPEAGQFSLTKRCVRRLQLLFNLPVSNMILLHFRHFHHKSWSCKNPSFTCYSFLYPPSPRQAYQSRYHNQVHTKHLLFFCICYHLYVTFPLQLCFLDILPSTLWTSEAIQTFLHRQPKRKFNIPRVLYTRPHRTRGLCCVVGISTYYWLEGPGCDTNWRQGIFCEISGFRHDIYERCVMTKNSAILKVSSLHQIRPVRLCGPPRLLHGYWLLPGGKADEKWPGPPTPSSNGVRTEQTFTSTPPLCF